MNKGTATLNEPLKTTITQHNTTIIAYLNRNGGRAGSAYLYKMLQKDFSASSTAAVRPIQLPLHQKNNRLFKRLIDIVLSVIVITGILTWLIPLMAILIKATSRGPVFFLQKRSRQHGKVFTCIKFRSMQVNPVADILPAAENDPRITPIGRIMRRTFIDELPQFFNVLKGEMSIIGPRPHMLSESLRFKEVVHYYPYRLKIKPGITGLAQVLGLEGAADTTQKMKDRIDADIFYLRNWSLKLDIIILYRTICKMLGM